MVSIQIPTVVPTIPSKSRLNSPVNDWKIQDGDLLVPVYKRPSFQILEIWTISQPDISGFQILTAITF